MSDYVGEFEKLLLYALLAEGDEADGAALRQRIEARTERAVSPGAVYTAMDRMEGRGFVESEVVTLPTEQGGRRQKRYRLQPAGALALDRAVRELDSMAHGLEEELATAVAAARAGERR